MSRLFLIRTHKRGPIYKEADGSVRFFDCKEDAKLARNKLGNELAVVSYGPDHKKAKAFNLKEFNSDMVFSKPSFE